jgi:hypothetical protein
MWRLPSVRYPGGVRAPAGVKIWTLCFPVAGDFDPCRRGGLAARVVGGGGQAGLEEAVRGRVRRRTALGGWKQGGGRQGEQDPGVRWKRRCWSTSNRHREEAEKVDAGEEGWCGETQRSSSPPSSSSSIRSAAPNPKRTRYKTWIVIAGPWF